MSPVAFACRLIEAALGEFGERVERMPDAELAAALDEIAGSGRSAASDLVAGILKAEHRRRWREATID